ncbi:vesicular glutamate transporter 2 [Oopsacas minuta]|uniref:Vesicular glutamate transporter 2 n=1 Tax=Oopsacas minuta TaxID=111878 RepID=A0AAV7JJ47_9METZ|nr:vesicular glutamate transporter 2 [Oopsacas minuta]
MPTFLQETIGLDIRTNGLLSAIPYAVFLVVNMTSGEIADFVRKRWISTGTTRKIFTNAGLFFSGFFLIICGYFGTTITTSIVFLSLGIGLQGMVIAGHNVNNLDIAPRYSGIIMGITNMFGTIPGFLGPQLAKAVAKMPPSTIPARSPAYIEIYRKEWINVFWVTAEICLFGMICYALLADGKVQSWALDEPNESSEDSEKDIEEKIN